jgi:hypothetical protein
MIRSNKIAILVAVPLMLAGSRKAFGQSQEWTEVPGGGLVRSSAVALSNSSSIDIYAVGLDDNVYTNRFHPSSNTWDGWTFFNASTPTGISAADGLGPVDLLVAQGSDLRPWVSRGETPTWQPSPPIPSGLEGRATPAVAAPTTGWGRIFTIASDGNIWTIEYSAFGGIFTSWANIGRPSGKNLTDVTAWADGGEATAVVRASDSTLWQRTANSDGTFEPWTQQVTFTGTVCRNDTAYRRAWNLTGGSRTVNLSPSGDKAGCFTAFAPACYDTLRVGFPLGPTIDAGRRPDLVHFFQPFVRDDYLVTNVKPDGTVWYNWDSNLFCGFL